MLELLTSILILVMTIDDFKHRYVKTLHLWLLALAITTITVSSNIIIVALVNTLINIIFLILLYAFIALIFRENPSKRLIGSGDLLFMLIISPLWELMPFAVYLLSSFVVALIYFHFANIKTIPLVGIMGLIIIIVWITTNILTLR